MRAFGSSPWLTLALLLAALSLGYVAVRQKLVLREKAVDLQIARDAAQQKHADLRRRLAAAESTQAQAEQQAAQLSRNASKTTGASSAKNGRTLRVGDVIKEHPEYAAIAARLAHRQIMDQYGAGLDKLNLPPEQLAKFKELLLERSRTAQDAQQAAAAAGLEQGTAGWWAAVKQATDVVDQEMTSLLGTDSRPVLQKLQVETGMRSQIQYDYAPAFEDAGVPLSSAQSSALTVALAGAATAQVPPEQRAGYYQVDPATGFSAADNHTFAAAAQVLSPAQLQALKDYQARERQRSAIISLYATKGTSLMVAP